VDASSKELLEKLSNAYGSGEARATLQLLVEDLLHTSWSRFAAGMEQLDGEEMNSLSLAVERILSGVPPQHITGKAWFYGRPFKVNRHVLIPRPETEELVAWVLSEQPSAPWSGIDIGTGSACIPVSIMCETPLASMTGLDISEDTLAVARHNAENMKAQVSFVHYDILNWQTEDFRDLDVIISNPPYIPESEAIELADRVRDHEPGLALFVPNLDPLVFYRNITEAALHWLKPGGRLYFEIHEAFGQAVQELLVQSGFEQVQLKSDMQGKDRMISGALMSND
jgi:release factor glutamine methyltransferase